MIYLVRHGLDDESFIGGYSNVGLIDEWIKQCQMICADRNAIWNSLHFADFIFFSY